jgi:hypothetical protein
MVFPKVIGAMTRKNVYTLPHEANKNTRYFCIGCHGKMTVYKTHLNNIYFKHDSKSFTCCKFYSKHPNESSEHAHAKYYLKWLIDHKKVSVRGHSINLREPDAKWKCVVEKSFVNGTRKYGIVDVAIVLDDEILFGFEVMKTHDTDLSTRPFPTLQITDTVIDDYSYNCDNCNF